MFVAKVFTPYLTQDQVVLWREDIPVVIFAPDLEKAISDLKVAFSVRVPEIEAKLGTQPGLKPGMYYHIEMVEVPEGISGAHSLYTLIASNKLIFLSF